MVLGGVLVQGCAMKKAHEHKDVTVAQYVEMAPEQLEELAKRMRLAIKERISPDQQVTVELATGIVLFHDPKVLRGDLERRTQLDKLTPQTHETGLSN